MAATLEELEELEEQALRLSSQERGALVQRLIASLEDEPEGSPEEIARAWEEEILRRISEIETGRARLVPAEDVFTEIDTLIASQK